MNGVINIYKEKGYSSFHVVYELRKLTGEAKVGHTGTLDPDVSGVLPICLGKATKLVGQLTDTDKTYVCRMLIGKKTDTQDLSGNVLEEVTQKEISDRINKDAIFKAFKVFTGDIEQIPPMYSAVKVGGVKLVDAARKGHEIERKPRPAKIYSYKDISISENLQHIDFTVECSKGTYIRTLCEDIGSYLGLPACMEKLERICACGLDISTAITIDQAKEYAAAGKLESHIIPVDLFFAEYDKITVKEEFERKLLFGNYLRKSSFIDEFPESRLMDQKTFRIYDSKGKFYALYMFDLKDKFFKCVKMFTDLD